MLMIAHMHAQCCKFLSKIVKEGLLLSKSKKLAWVRRQDTVQKKAWNKAREGLRANGSKNNVLQSMNGSGAHQVDANGKYHSPRELQDVGKEGYLSKSNDSNLVKILADGLHVGPNGDHNTNGASPSYMVQIQEKEQAAQDDSPSSAVSQEIQLPVSASFPSENAGGSEANTGEAGADKPAGPMPPQLNASGRTQALDNQHGSGVAAAPTSKLRDNASTQGQRKMTRP
jgi:hypothetical protein